LLSRGVGRSVSSVVRPGATATHPTGTWKVIRGTGAYAGLTGGGGAVGVALSNGTTRAQFEGFLSLK